MPSAKIGVGENIRGAGGLSTTMTFHPLRLKAEIVIRLVPILAGHPNLAYSIGQQFNIHLATPFPLLEA